MPITKLIQSLGTQASAKKQRAAAIALYYKNPNRCLQCGSVIEVKDGMKVTKARDKKFCDSSCAGSYNNKMFRKRHMTNHCACGALVPSGRKYCSEICRKAVHQLRPKSQTKANASLMSYLGDKEPSCAPFNIKAGAAKSAAMISACVLSSSITLIHPIKTSRLAGLANRGIRFDQS